MLNPDFAKIAEAMGMPGITIRDPEEVNGRMDEVFKIISSNYKHLGEVIQLANAMKASEFHNSYSSDQTYTYIYYG